MVEKDNSEEQDRALRKQRIQTLCIFLAIISFCFVPILTGWIIFRRAYQNDKNPIADNFWLVFGSPMDVFITWFIGIIMDSNLLLVMFPFIYCGYTACGCDILS